MERFIPGKRWQWIVCGVGAADLFGGALMKSTDRERYDGDEQTVPAGTIVYSEPDMTKKCGITTEDYTAKPLEFSAVDPADVVFEQ